MPQCECLAKKQARKPRSYASLKLRPTHLLTYLLTRVKCRATSVAKKVKVADSRGGERNAAFRPSVEGLSLPPPGQVLPLPPESGDSTTSMESLLPPESGCSDVQAV